MMAQLDVLVHQWARTADFQTLFHPQPGRVWCQQLGIQTLL
jgi:hypothetical protein